MALVFDGSGIVTGFSFVASGDFSITLPDYVVESAPNSASIILGRQSSNTTFLGIADSHGVIRARINGDNLNLSMPNTITAGQTLRISLVRAGGTLTITENVLGISDSISNTDSVVFDQYGIYAADSQYPLFGEMTGVATFVGDAGGIITHNFEQATGTAVLVDTTSANNGTLSGFTTGGFVTAVQAQQVFTIANIPDGAYPTELWSEDKSSLFSGIVSYVSGVGSIPVPETTGAHYGLVRDNNTPSTNCAPIYLVVTQSSDPADPADPVALEGYDIILLIGQSNMVGRRGPVDGVLDATNVRISQFGNSSQAVTLASDPLDHLDETSNTVGMGLTLAKAHLATLPSNRNVLLVPSADGGTGFGTGFWRSGGTGYSSAVSSTNAALLVGGLDNRLIAMVWHQGESDRGMSESQYSTDLDSLISGFRSEITGASGTTPVIVGEVPTWSTQYGAGVAAALADTPSRTSNTAWVPTSDLVDGGDSLHFDAASLRTLGSRYYTALTGGGGGGGGGGGTPSGTALVEAFHYDASIDNLTSYTFNNVVTGTGSLVVAVSYRSSNNTPTIVGGSLLHGPFDNGGSSVCFLQIPSVTAGTRSITIDIGSMPSRLGIQCWTISGGDLANVTAVNDANYPLTATIPAVTGGVVLAAYLAIGPTDSDSWTGLTERQGWSDFGDTFGGGSADLEVTASGNLAMQVSNNGNFPTLLALHIPPL
jgi:hypothetical protein